MRKSKRKEDIRRTANKRNEGKAREAAGEAGGAAAERAEAKI